MNKLRDNPHSQTARNAGFTLIELLAVITIIMLLAGAFIALAQFANRKAKESAARAEIASIDTALEQYKLANGSYPEYLTNLIAGGYLRNFSTNRIALYGYGTYTANGIVCALVVYTNLLDNGTAIVFSNSALQ